MTGERTGVPRLSTAKRAGGACWSSVPGHPITVRIVTLVLVHPAPRRGLFVTRESPGRQDLRLGVASRRSSLVHMDRITIDPAVMGGVPCLRGLRIPVATVVNMVAGGMTAQQIVDELPPLETR